MVPVIHARSALALLVCGVALGGCAAEIATPAYADVSADVRVAPVLFHTPPPLVVVDEGVAVVVDAPEPVYFVEGAYWRPRGGVWYRAPRWDSPFVRADIEVVPRTIVHRDHARYTHYRVAGRGEILHEEELRERSARRDVRPRIEPDARVLRPEVELRERAEVRADAAVRVDLAAPGPAATKKPRKDQKPIKKRPLPRTEERPRPND